MNVGCVPSKMLTTAADRVQEIKESAALGIEADFETVDFARVMGRMRDAVKRRRKAFAESYRSRSGLDVYHGTARFIGERAVEVVGERMRGEKVFVVCGARPFVPPVDGLDKVDFLTNETLLELEERPASVVVMGGGYIGVEYAHFLSAMGVDVTIVERGDRLVSVEEETISELLQRRLSERMTVMTGTAATSVRKDGGEYVVVCEDRSSGTTMELRADGLLVAAGRRSNADTLDVRKANVEVNDKGYIVVNGRLETSSENVWAFGDAIGRGMFTHVANREVDVAWHNSTHEGSSVEMSYHAVPHAVFSWPQIASVGITERQARAEKREVVTATVRYSGVMKGEAMAEDQGFAKVIISTKAGEILGLHIIGPSAPILIQEVVNVMTRRGDASDALRAMHAFPTLPELVERALREAEDLR